MRVVVGIVITIIFSVVFSRETCAQTIATVSATPSVSPTIYYDLAYPGLLPDHPLYVLKVIRDKIVSSLINDPIKRAQFNLLTSDKRFNGGVYLANKKKYTQAIDTISKSNNYFHEAIVALERAKAIDRDTGPVRDTMLQAIQKRYEIVAGLEEQIGEQDKKALKSEVNRLKKLENRLHKI